MQVFFSRILELNLIIFSYITPCFSFAFSDKVGYTVIVKDAREYLYMVIMK